MSDLKPIFDGESAAPAADELIRRAEALVPLLRANAVRADQLRRLPDESVRALEEAGLFRMTQPVGRGGYGADAATVSKVMTLIASGCASTTWVMMIYSSVADLAELLPEAALAEVYADPHPKIAGVFGKAGALVERVSGGFRVRRDGRWPFNSGCHHANWDLLRLMVEELDGSSWPAFAAVPISDLTICDDWDVMGARGTGSNTVSCGELFIPEHRVARVPIDLRGVIRPDVSVAQNVALPLGMARYAMRSFRDLATTRGIPHLGYERMIDAPVVHTGIARAAVDIKLIEAYQQWALSTLDPSSGGLKPEDGAILSAGSVRCFELARSVIETLYALCPSTEIQSERPIQRLLRDVHVFQHQHAATPFISYELCGREAGRVWRQPAP
jgi:3-hydroxy-9,10-secoandrosta-1,3,5(10)-triene-9,17-dione monooxygenase